MSANTTRLNLYKPGGGATGLILPDEIADIDKINGNMDLIDAAIGARVVTSTTRPTTPFSGQLIYETDTRNTMVYNLSLTAWTPIGVPNAASSAIRDALFPSPVAGNTVYRTDLSWVEEYSAIYNAATNLPGRIAAGWYPMAVDIQRKYQQATGYALVASGTVIPTGGTFVVKRRPYKQRIMTTIIGSGSTNVAGTLGVNTVTTAGGTLILGGTGVVVTSSANGVVYASISVVEIASGVGTDVTISLQIAAASGASSGAFGGFTAFDISVEGEW